MSRSGWDKFLVFLIAVVSIWGGLHPEVNNFDFNSMKDPLAKYDKADISQNQFFKPNDPKRAAFEQRLKNYCPENIYQIFDKKNVRWKGQFAKNCKAMLSSPEMEGEFAPIDPNPKDGQKVEYAFFKGSSNADKLVVIAGGAFFDKHFSLPYLVLLNKVLGFSCAIADYRGHENSWDQDSQNNPLYKLRKASCGIDSGKFTFGHKEGHDFYDMVHKVRRENDFIKESFALGICFGGAVVARAQKISHKKDKYPLFKGVALISPLPGVHELIENIVSNDEAFRIFAGKFDDSKFKNSAGFKVMRFMAGRPIFSQLLTSIISKKLQVDKVSSLSAYEKIGVPTLMVASRDSDAIVTRPMALKVWNAIKTDKKFMLWSAGVGHLFNWRHETAQLGISLEAFFSGPEDFIQQPLEALK